MFSLSLAPKNANCSSECAECSAKYNDKNHKIARDQAIASLADESSPITHKKRQRSRTAI